MKHVPPAITETAFNCPLCGALAKQFWHDVYVREREEKNPTPVVILNREGDFDFSEVQDQDMRERLAKWAEDMLTGRPFLQHKSDTAYCNRQLHNVTVSRCFNCKEASIWIYDRLVYPISGEAPPANADLPDSIRRDYDEAGTILDLSPRGAAALIRLCIQKLCKELGQPGENINADIAALVATGLDSRVQKALDAVRVIGNHAVHPGQIDLRDDRATAESLFRLLNLIVEKMISEPKHVDEVYELLPASARAAIEKRDASK